MGTKVQSKTCLLPGYLAMRELNEDSSSYGWPLFYGDKSLTNGQYYNGYSSRGTTDTSAGCDKDVVKQKMLEHEAIFKKQVYELHRLYRTQRDLMEEIEMKELHRTGYIEGTSFSSRPSTSQITIDDPQRWHVPSFPFANSFCARSSAPGIKTIHSPLIAVKYRQDDPYTPQNGGSQGDIKVMESRPTKVRRKVFDLQLPANEYFDSDDSEKFSDEKGSRTSSHLAGRNCKIGPQISLKLLDCDGDKGRSLEDTSRSEQFIRDSGFADLNEPVGMEETNASGHSFYSGPNSFLSPPVKTELQFLCSKKENLFTTHRGNGYELLNNQSLGTSGNGREWTSHVSEAGYGESNLQYNFHGCPSEKLSSLPQSMHKVHDEVSGSPSACKVDLSVNDLEISRSCYETSNNKHLDSKLSLHKPSTLPVAHSSNVAKSLSHSITSWERPTSRYDQKSMSTQMYSCLNLSATLSASLSGDTNGIITEAWPTNRTLKSNLGFGCEYPVQNGFHYGSPSGFKEVSIMSHDYLRHSDSKGVAKQPVNLDSARYCRNSNFNHIKWEKDSRMGFVLSNGASNKLVPEQGSAFIDNGRKQEAPLAVFPWFRTRASCEDEEATDDRVFTARGLQASSISKQDDSRWGSNETVMHNMTAVSCSSDFEGRRSEIGDNSRGKKILGFPMFGKPHTFETDSSLLTSSVSSPKPSEDEIVENKWKMRAIDINMPCDLAVSDLGEQNQRENLVERVNSDNEDAKFRCQIDLNLSATDEEASMEPTPGSKLKMTALIDLETPANPDMEEDVFPAAKELETTLASQQNPQQDGKQPQDELMMKAAEAIVAISSAVCRSDLDDVVDRASNQPETSIKESLVWFVDIVSSCFNNLEEMLDASGGGKYDPCDEGPSSEEFDVFESMTLRQVETKEEDYMPQPLVPENFKLEEPGPCLLPMRPRRGPARRGRQRRDFQRDILPGLVSLSRHEVTEDLQTFGGLMRATGHPWHLGLTRRSSTRNGCGRGRKRMAASLSPPAATNVPCTPLIQQINNVEVELEDSNLTGWVNTPRRPRRQRCAAGNPPIPLT